MTLKRDLCILIGHIHKWDAPWSYSTTSHPSGVCILVLHVRTHGRIFVHLTKSATANTSYPNTSPELSTLMKPNGYQLR